MTVKIPTKVLKRLTLYHSMLTELSEIGLKVVTSKQLSSRLRVDDSQVRKDIKMVSSGGGRCRVGYEIKSLKRSIEKKLGFASEKKAVVIGAGGLGSAIARYDNFNDYGLNIIALFDVDKDKIDTKVSDKNIYHMDKLSEIVKDEDVKIVILSAPKAAAQGIVNMLDGLDIEYIWNFTPSVIKVPEGVLLRNESLVANFLRLVHS